MNATAQTGCIKELLGDRARLAGAVCPCEKCGGDFFTREEIVPEAPRGRPVLRVIRQAERRYGARDAKMAAAGNDN